MAAKFDHGEMLSVVSFGVRIRFKDKSWTMRLLGRLTPWDSGFMQRPTTVGTTVYFPSQKWVDQNAQTAWMQLAHELVHVGDYRRLGWRFHAAYAMPQLLAVFSLMTFVFYSWWPALFLLFLLPIPAPWRMQFEMRAFAMTLATHFWLNGGGIPQEMKAKIARNFTGPRYYWAWPFKKAVKKRIGRWTKKILCGELLTNPEFQATYGEVHDLIKARVQPRRS